MQVGAGRLSIPAAARLASCRRIKHMLCRGCRKRCRRRLLPLRPPILRLTPPSEHSIHATTWPFQLRACEGSSKLRARGGCGWPNSAACARACTLVRQGTMQLPHQAGCKQPRAEAASTHASCPCPYLSSPPRTHITLHLDPRNLPVRVAKGRPGATRHALPDTHVGQLCHNL